MVWTDSPEAWQQYSILLAKRHHGATNFQEVPDRDRGDLGIEGFSRDGCAYQCYCAEEPVSTSELYDKQAAKITRDLRKFRDNAPRLKDLFGPTRIRSWNLLVPRFESSRLIEHGERKAQEVRSANFAYVDAKFCVQILTESDFRVEVQQLAGVGLTQIRLEPTGNATSNIADNLVENLRRKVSKLKHLPSASQAQLVEVFVRDYLDGQNLLEQFHQNYPELYASARQVKADWERFLDVKCLAAESTPAALLSDQLKSFKTKLVNGLPGIADYNLNHLTHEAVADWLLRCPLNFPDEA